MRISVKLLDWLSNLDLIQINQEIFLFDLHN